MDIFRSSEKKIVILLIVALLFQMHFRSTAF